MFYDHGPPVRRLRRLERRAALARMERWAAGCAAGAPWRRGASAAASAAAVVVAASAAAVVVAAAAAAVVGWLRRAAVAARLSIVCAPLS